MPNLHNHGASGKDGDALAVVVAWFPTMKSTKPTKRRLKQVLDDIKNGKWRVQVDRLRVILAKQGKEAYKAQKVKLPSFYLSGTASAPATMLTHSGIVQVDLDGLGDRLPVVRAEAETDRHAAAVFISPGGGGLKIAFRLDPLGDSLDRDEHKRAFAAVSAYFVQSYGVTPDPQCKNVNRHCLVSYDPHLYRNASAVPFDWKANEKAAPTGEEEREDSSLSSLNSLRSLRSLTFQPQLSIEEDSAEIALFDPEPIEEAFARAHPDVARLYRQLLGRRQRPKQRERNQCAVDISTFLVRVVSEKNAMLMQGHWYDLYHRGRFNDTREQHLQDAKAHWDNVLGTYWQSLSAQEQRRYLAIENADIKAAFRIFRDCALSPRDESPPLFHMSWRQLSIRLGVSSDKAGDIFDVFISSKIIKPNAPPVMYAKGAQGRSTRYRWLLPYQATP